MRDPDLVQRAERAANALEQAWMRWRVQHGLGSGPQPPVSSYVGYSLEEPWGQARVVLGVAAEEAERFAAVLEGHDCEGPIHEAVSARPERDRPSQVEKVAAAWTALNGSLTIPAQPPASRPPSDCAPSVPAQYVPAKSGPEQPGDVAAADAPGAAAQPGADSAVAAHAGAGLPEAVGSSYPAPEFAADDLAAVQPSLPAALGRAAAVADMPAELPPVTAAHLQELAALPPIPPEMSQAIAPPAPAADPASIESPGQPSAASRPGNGTTRPRPAAPSELSSPAAGDRQQDRADQQEDRADQLQEHGDGAPTSSHRSPESGSRTRLRPVSKVNRQRRLVADHDVPSWQPAASQGPQTATDTVV